MAQLGVTDMRLPIQYAFSYPERWAAPWPSLDLARAARLDFEVPDTTAFPCLQLAYRALAAERSLPVVLNAANEIAVDAFLEGRIGFTAIHEITAQTMAAHVAAEVATLEAVRAVDAWARQYAAEIARGLRLKGMKSEV
jgi:1-deoxy-D-xylulose-5-phosphate reductoisomerase